MVRLRMQGKTVVAGRHTYVYLKIKFSRIMLFSKVDSSTVDGDARFVVLF